MNERRGPFSDPRVREAVARAIDRQAIIDGAMFGYGTPIGSHFAPHHPAYLNLTETSAHDPERARALLAEAGLADGFETTLKLPPPSYARRGGEIAAAQLREVGIETEIQTIEWAQWLEEVFTGHDYDMTIVAHTEPMDIGIYADPDYYFGYDSPEMQALMERFDATSEEAERIGDPPGRPAPDRRGPRQRLPLPAPLAQRGARPASRASGPTRRPRPPTSPR